MSPSEKRPGKRAPSTVDRRQSTTEPAPHWRCDVCEHLLDSQTNDGSVYFDYPEWHAYREALEAWTALHPGPSHTMDELEGYPELHWHVVHDVCDRAALDRGDVYWIAVNRLDTWTKLASWSAHLHGKDWFADTDWGELLYRAGVGTVAA